MQFANVFESLEKSFVFAVSAFLVVYMFGY
jgi:hypothetical protein